MFILALILLWFSNHQHSLNKKYGRIKYEQGNVGQILASYFSGDPRFGYKPEP
jgi:hypothetical protein